MTRQCKLIIATQTCNQCLTMFRLEPPILREGINNTVLFLIESTFMKNAFKLVFAAWNWDASLQRSLFTPGLFQGSIPTKVTVGEGFADKHLTCHVETTGTNNLLLLSHIASMSAATVRLCPAGLVLTLLTWDSGWLNAQHYTYHSSQYHIIVADIRFIFWHNRNVINCFLSLDPRLHASHITFWWEASDTDFPVHWFWSRSRFLIKFWN